jgi:hypothetical protein
MACVKLYSGALLTNVLLFSIKMTIIIFLIGYATYGSDFSVMVNKVQKCSINEVPKKAVRSLTCRKAYEFTKNSN